MNDEDLEMVVSVTTTKKTEQNRTENIIKAVKMILETFESKEERTKFIKDTIAFIESRDPFNRGKRISKMKTIVGAVNWSAR